MSFLILLVAHAFAPALPAALPQDPVQMSRIASDQRLVAEQVRRLTKLLEQLEARDRAEERIERADLLAGAAARLAGVSSGTDLAAAMEAIAGDLAELRTGSAVEGQTSTLQALEEILQLLLQSQTDLQEQQRAEDLKERIAALEKLKSRQEELRKRAEDLLEQLRESDVSANDPSSASSAEPKADSEGDPKSGSAKPPPAEAKDGERSASEESAESKPGSENSEPNSGQAKAATSEERDLQEEIAKLAQEQAALAEKIAELRNSGRQEAAERASEHAAEAADRLERASGEPSENDASAAPKPSGEQSPSSDSPPPTKAGQPGESGEPGQPGEPGEPGEPNPNGEQQPPQEPQAGPPSSSPPPRDGEQQQERAIEEQQNAEQALEEAIQQAEDELDRIEQRQQLQELEDVRMLAEQILEQHRSEEVAILELLAVGADRLTRAQRARLRQVARSEEDLAAATQSLLIKIETLGASTFPFFLGTIQKDHERLAREVGPPRLQLDEHAAVLAADITGNWEMLLDVIRTEEERRSREMEQEPQQDGQPAEPEENEKQPLVDFAQELQLLKRLEQGLGRDLLWLRQKFDTYGAAGIEAGPEEEHALSILLDRQLELRRQFEDMLARLHERMQDSLPAEDL